MRVPRYPVYIPSRGRADKMLTARMFDRDGIDYKVVVEPSQAEAYARAGYAKRLLVLPEDDRGLTYSRNWITAHSRARGDKRHWQVDDDCMRAYRVLRGMRIPCESSALFAVSEDLADRYENVALLSPNYTQFVPVSSGGPINYGEIPPFYLNHRCYTWILFLNSLPYSWRGPSGNEDADMTLQVLAGGWCTILLNAFVMKTITTMQAKGGQTDAYLVGRRLHMVRWLERTWPGVVGVYRRFQHPQHLVKGHWTRFDNRLRLRRGVRLDRMRPNEYGMKVQRGSLRTASGERRA